MVLTIGQYSIVLILKFYFILLSINYSTKFEYWMKRDGF